MYNVGFCKIFISKQQPTIVLPIQGTGKPPRKAPDLLATAATVLTAHHHIVPILRTLCLSHADLMLGSQDFAET